MSLSYETIRREVLKLIDELDIPSGVALAVILKSPGGRFSDGRQSNSRRR